MSREGRKCYKTPFSSLPSSQGSREKLCLLFLLGAVGKPKKTPAPASLGEMVKESLPASPWLLVCIRAVQEHHCRAKMCMAVAHWGPTPATAIEEVTFLLG